MRIGFGGIVIGGLTLLAYRMGLKYDMITAQTMAFIVLGLSQLVHAYNTRSDNKSIFKVGLFTNKYLVGATVFSAILQLVVVFVPFLREIFKVALLNGIQWIEIIIISLMPLVIVEVYKLLNRASKAAGRNNKMQSRA
jgi:Ca2+-transporting ATPase